MMDQTKVTGLILAGGRGQRMEGQDKGWVSFRGEPLVMRALNTMNPLTSSTLISANRNLEAYARLGHGVVQDARTGFDGPLAGIEAALSVIETPYLLTLPCDTPLMNRSVLERLLVAGAQTGSPLCVAAEGVILHPVVLLIQQSLVSDLVAFLDSGERRVRDWLMRHNPVKVDCSDCPECFENANTPQDLLRLAQRAASP
jgi:molybdopterin-guanine dinucleotide biosynthesis protein A